MLARPASPDASHHANDEGNRVPSEPEPGTAPRLSRRQRREERTVAVMVGLYCTHHHADSTERATGRPDFPALCPDCAELLDYAVVRVERCLFGAAKPVCNRCTVHCFRPERREQIRTVMRYSGPRMTFRHPYLAIRHLLDRQAPASPSSR